MSLLIDFYTIQNQPTPKTVAVSAFLFQVIIWDYCVNSCPN